MDLSPGYTSPSPPPSGIDTRMLLVILSLNCLISLTVKEPSNSRILALNGSESVWDITKNFHPSLTTHDRQNFYPTLLRRVDDLAKRGYLVVTERLKQDLDKSREKALYGLSLKGLFASLVEPDVRANVLDVLIKNPQTFYPPLWPIVKALFKHEIISEKDLENIAYEVFIETVKFLPNDIEILDESSLKVVVISLAFLLQSYVAVLDEQKRRDLQLAIETAGFKPMIEDLLRDTKSSLDASLKAIDNLADWLDYGDLGK
jgi:hypothetical protein